MLRQKKKKIYVSENFLYNNNIFLYNFLYIIFFYNNLSIRRVIVCFTVSLMIVLKG